MTKKKSANTQKWYTEQDAHGASSKFGQMIGDAFADVVITFISEYLTSAYPDFVLLAPEVGKTTVKLEMFGGTSRQLDNVIAPKDSNDPVALFESKWLKDARHHNDKGAWILQLKEVRKKYPSVRGAAAILAGYWTEGVGVMFKSEAGVQMVLVAGDEQIYSTLQEPINKFTKKHKLPNFLFDVREIRESLPRPHDLANCLVEMKASGELQVIAAGWLDFSMQVQNKTLILGRNRIKAVIDSLLSPLPSNPRPWRFEIAMEIDTGNIIYEEFDDIEDVIGFVHLYHNNPQAILEKITPKPRPSIEPEESENNK